MKVLCEHTPCGPHYVRSGWGRVFMATGHDFRFWSPGSKPAMDAFSEFEPDVFIGTTYGVDRAVYKCLAARPRLRVALFASAWGPLVDGLDPGEFPVVVAGAEERRTIARLKAETGHPAFVFLHVTDRYLDGVLGGWRSAGVEPAGLLNAADLYQYGGATPRPDLRCDASFVGGRWPYKARNLDRFVLPLCHPGSGLHVKVFSAHAWPVVNRLGHCSDDEARDLFASSAVNLNVSEPHSTDPRLGFDVIERPFKVLAAGGFCVSDYVPEAAEEVFPDGEVVFARTPEEYRKVVTHYARNQGEREWHTTRGRRTVLARHTYHHRVADMLRRLGLPAEADRAMAALAALVSAS